MQVIPLVENGEEMEVTEENKMEYLNALAQYRLTKRVSEEIAHFLKGKVWQKVYSVKIVRICVQDWMN